MFISRDTFTPSPFIIYFVVCGLWSFLFYKACHCREEAPKLFWLVALVAMICGFIWTNFVIIILIDCINAVGIITKLSSTYLALTIIAVGNALPDAIITIALAKKGKAVLGITGSYAG